MTFNPHTATQQELRDWLAEQDGWAKVKDVHGGNAWRKRSLLHDPCSNWSHPYPRTIDGAAAALPEGCSWWVDCRLVQTANGSEWAWLWKVRIQVGNGVKYVECIRTDDEITDRYRLACLARVAMKEDSK